MQTAGKLLILVGVLAVILGALMLVFDRIPILGKLPGDINIKRGPYQIIFPLTSSILLSLLLSLLIWVVTRFRGK
jgi:hypothetical protein